MGTPRFQSSYDGLVMSVVRSEMKIAPPHTDRGYDALMLPDATATSRSTSAEKEDRDAEQRPLVSLCGRETCTLVFQAVVVRICDND